MDKVRDLREKFFQVDDEYLNGYAKLCGINATGVYLSLCRHANKQQQSFPSKRLIAQELSISERSVYSALKKLEEWGIIAIEQQGRKEDGSYRNLLYTLMNKKGWKDKPSATGAVGKKQHDPSANDDTSRRQLVPNKETHNKDTHRRIAGCNPAGALILKDFELVDPKNKGYYANITQRKACDFLIAEYGIEAVLKRVSVLPRTNKIPFFPSITTPVQLRDKWVQLQDKVEQKRAEVTSKKTIII